MSLKEYAKDNTIFLCKTGSHAYGTNIETSDEDFRGLFIGTPENVFRSLNDIYEYSNEDKVIYEIGKAIPLFENANPNMLELLYIGEEEIIENSEEYSLLRDNRDIYLTQKAVNSFLGYAKQQLSRIKGHNKHINNPQKEDFPKQSEYLKLCYNFGNKQENYKMNYSNQKFLAKNLGHNTFLLFKVNSEEFRNNFIDKKGNLNILENEVFSQKIKKFNVNSEKPDCLVRFNKEKYKEDFQIWKNYWDWKHNRNEKRSELEEKYGYDTKHAMHLVRLLEMGIEIIKTGNLTVKRENAEYLLSIRNGEYSYEQIIEKSELLEKELFSSLKNCKLPKECDKIKSTKLMLELYKRFWGKKKYFFF